MLSHQLQILRRQISQEWDAYPLRAAVSVLLSFSLIHRDKDGMISIHPLVHTDPYQRDNLQTLLRLRKSEKGCYFGEYLAQGNMDVRGRCVVINMQRLIDAGLFELKPELGDKSRWIQWANRVICLRDPFEASQDAPTAAYAEVCKVITIVGA